MKPGTSTPWKVEECQDEPYGDIRIVGGLNMGIAKLWLDDAPVQDYNDEQVANAKFIVEAVNQYQKLKDRIEALEAENARASEGIRAMTVELRKHQRSWLSLVQLQVLPSVDWDKHAQSMANGVSAILMTYKDQEQ